MGIRGKENVYHVEKNSQSEKKGVYVKQRQQEGFSGKTKYAEETQNKEDKMKRMQEREIVSEVAGKRRGNEKNKK